MKRRHKSSGIHKCARFTKALSFEGLHTKIDFDAHNKATKDAFAEARKNYPQANKFRRRSLAEEKQLIRSFQASRRAIASLRQIEEATKISRKTLGRRRAEWEFWANLMDPTLENTLLESAAIICCRTMQQTNLSLTGSLVSDIRLHNICEQLELPRWVLLVFLEIQAEMWRVQQQPVVQKYFSDLLNQCNRQSDLKRVQEQLLLAGIPQWILIVECNARATHYDISKDDTLKLIDYLLEWDPTSFDVKTMFETCQVPFWMFNLLLEDIAIQCHSFSESKINAHSRNSVWQEANTQYYVRQIFGAGGSKTLLPGAIDVCDGICLNVNGPGGASATIIVRRCCAVSIYVMSFGMNKGSIGMRQSSSHTLHVGSTRFSTLPCAFCKHKRKGFATPELTTNLPLHEPKHDCKGQQQTDEIQPKKRCKTPTHLTSSMNYSTPLPPLSGLTRGASKLSVPEASGFCISAPPAPKTPRGHLRHPNPIGGSKKDSKHKAATVTPIIRSVVSRRLDFQVPASETKYLAQMNTSELFDLHFTASDGKHSSDEDEASQSSQTDGFDPVFSQLPRIPEGLV